MIRLAALAGAWTLGLALISPAISPAHAADLALVIGNHDYARAPDAVSAQADAEAVSEALEQGGYEVIGGTDLNRGEMRRLIADFAGRIEQADRIVVFYSGHALRTGGRTYLAPVDQGNDTLVEVMMDGVPLELVLRLAGRESGQSVAFIDGAQLDGFTPRAFAEPGLAHIEPPEGVLVISAAAPGRAIARRSAGRSEFGRNVAEGFLAPGATIGEAVGKLGSRAWVAGDTASSLALVPEAEQAAEAEPAEPSPASVESRLDLTRSERREIQRGLTALGYDTRGTEGIFGPGTRTAIRNWQRANDREATGYLTQDQVAQINRQAAEARAAQPSPDEIESRLNLTRSERSRIQENLTALGYDTRGTGGTFGQGTRSAVRNWQRANEIEATGYLTQDQVARIERQASEARAAQPSPEEIESRLNLTRSERSRIQEDLTALGYDTRGSGGTFGPGTRTAIRNWQRANDLEETGYLKQEQAAAISRQASEARADTGEPGPAEVEARLDLTGAERSQIQEDLNLLGYDTRGTDGVFGPGTRTAIRNWQRANDFEETGYLTGEQVAAIGRHAGQAGAPPTGGAQPAPQDPAAAEDALGLTRNDRLSIEQRLAFLGFAPGEQDGFFDRETRRAIEAYQRSRGYPATGYLDRQTVAGIVDETQGARTGIVTGAEVLMDILRGLGGQQ